MVDFYCDEEPLASGFCIFYDKDYLQNKTNYEEHKRQVLERLKHKVNHAISYNEPLLCIGFQLPDFSLSDLSINKELTMPIYFSGSQFFGKADFSGVNFQERTYFSKAKFRGEALFDKAKFRITSFNKAKFEGVPLPKLISREKPTKTNKLMLRCNNCTLLIFANAKVSQQSC